MVEIRRGDLVKTDGTEFHVKASGDGRITFWAKDTGMTHTETFAVFVQRAQQSGGIKIVPGEGKFESPDEEDNRDVYFETV